MDKFDDKTLIPQSGSTFRWKSGSVASRQDGLPASFPSVPNACCYPKPSRTGALVVSLDFELHWGVRDHTPLDRRERTRLIAARAGIPRLLDLFEEFSVHATWATVGILFAHSREEALAFQPQERPHYEDARFDPYREALGEGEHDDPFHFAPSLIDEIARRKGQELASHSFSHYYCLESGQTDAEFEADLQSATAIAALHGYILRSYVFPRNQVNLNCLAALQRAGIWAYRGNELASIKQATSFAEQRRAYRRAGRLLDSFVNLYGEQTSAWPIALSTPVSVPASRYLRPYHPAARLFENRLVQRIGAALRHAAECGEIFHLWWHPEDFAPSCDQNLRVLRRVLELYATCRERWGMTSASMAEIASRIRTDTAVPEYAGVPKSA